MAIIYTSKHHGPDDPGGLIGDALDMGAEFPGPAQDVLLAWLLRLDTDVVPSQAAGRLIAAYGLGTVPSQGGACAELVTLLRQTAQTDAQHLSPPRRRRRRS